VVDVVAGMTVLTLGGAEAVVVGTRLRVTDGAGATVADVVGAEVVWLVVRGDGGAVVISGEGEFDWTGHHCLVQLKIARDAPRLLGFAI
jgi:hypothetical protein